MITTVNVFCRLIQPDGTVAKKTRIEFRLPIREIDDGVILPELVVAVTDDNGEVTVPLWPNAKGLNSSYYDVTIFTYSKIVHDRIVVPDSDCNLHDIMQRLPIPPIDAAQQAVQAAQQAAAEAKQWAEQAQGNAPSVEVGTVTVGSPTSVTNSGTPKNAKLDFVLEKGKDGAKGDKGEQGVQGLQGETGKSAYQAWLDAGNSGMVSDFLNSLKGAKGSDGQAGKDGKDGVDGKNGKDGLNGTDGKSATITVGTVKSGTTPAVTNVGSKNDAIFNFILAKGEKGDKGADGARGADGVQGSAGKSATVSIGTVTQGTTANVTNTGSSNDAVLNFTLPKGDKGDTGAAGTNGKDGKDGVNGHDGSDGKSAYQTWLDSGHTGSENDFLTSLKGDKGADGAKGVDGKAATIEVGTVTSGTTAAVTNAGTTSAAKFNFVLPKGDKGADGTNGTNGKSAYQEWLDAGNSGTEADFLASLKGEKGDRGDDGSSGGSGTDTGYIYFASDNFQGTTPPRANGQYSCAGGNDARANNKNTVAIGYQAITDIEGAVVIGQGSTTSNSYPYDAMKLDGEVYNFAGKGFAPFSVGSVGGERRLQNVSPGRIQTDSTDAVNGSQLNVALTAIKNRYTKSEIDDKLNNLPSGTATIAVGTVEDGNTVSVTNSGTSTNAIFDFVLEKGRDGIDGKSATVKIGTVTTGDNANVTNSGGDNHNVVLDFVIPKGKDGTNGIDGANGNDGKDGKAATITVGTVTEGNTVSVINSGSENAAKLDFVLKAGRDGTNGADGAQGADGKAATIKIGTVTSGTTASVTNSGTATDATFDFVLPIKKQLGVSDKYVDVTNNRVLGTTYTNTRDYPMFVAIIVNMVGPNATGTLYIDSLPIIQALPYPRAVSAAVSLASLTAIIPPASTYILTADKFSIKEWFEL